MLVLARTRDETVVLSDIDTGEVIARVTVVDVRGDKVRLGFTAPDAVRVDREEVWDSRQKEK